MCRPGMRHFWTNDKKPYLCKRLTGTEVEDSTLIARVKAGDRGAFNELYGIYWASLVNYAGLFVGDDGAEDVVQDSFMKLWEEVEYIAYDKAKSFLFSTAYHRMIDVLRRETKFGDIENVADRAGDVQEGYTGLQEILDMALEKLPPVQKTVILLRDYEAYSYEEIAGITGLNESQVKVYIFRARAFMKAYIRRPDVVV